MKNKSPPEPMVWTFLTLSGASDKPSGHMANELRMIICFLADGSLAIIDYESIYRKENKIKYLGYESRNRKILYDRKQSFPKLRVIIIYGG